MFKQASQNCKESIYGDFCCHHLGNGRLEYISFKHYNNTKRNNIIIFDDTNSVLKNEKKISLIQRKLKYLMVL